MLAGVHDIGLARRDSNGAPQEFGGSRSAFAISAVNSLQNCYYVLIGIISRKTGVAVLPFCYLFPLFGGVLVTGGTPTPFLAFFFFLFDCYIVRFLFSYGICSVVDPRCRSDQVPSRPPPPPPPSPLRFCPDLPRFSPRFPRAKFAPIF